MKRLITLCIPLILLTLFFSACSTPAAQAEPPAGPITLTDGLGRTVVLDQPAQKIISLAPSNTEILFALGAGDQVIGRDNFSDYPAAALEIITIGDWMSGLNLEQIAGLEPDLVLASGLNSPEQVQSFETLGLKVFLLPNPVDFESLYGNIQTVAELAGRQSEAAVLIPALKARVEAVRKVVAPLSYAPAVFYELDATDPAKPWTAGPGTYISYLIQQAGGYNVGDVLSSDWAQLSQEELIVKDPDFILLGDANFGGVTPEQVAARPGWGGLKSVRQQQVLVFDDNLVSRPGPRMVDGLEQLAKIFHAELFK